MTEKQDPAFPSTAAEFLTLFALLVLAWTTGSWVYELSDWTDHGGFFDASIGQIVGSFAGQGVQFFVLFGLPVLVWRGGGALPRGRHLRLSLGLLLFGLACTAFALARESDGPVTSWSEWLLIALIVQPTVAGLLGLGHWALRTRRERKSPR